MADLMRVGDRLDDPTTGSHVQLLELRPDGFVIEQVVEAGKTKSILNHFHKSWTEKFEIISGTARYNVAGVENEGAAGHIFWVNPGQTHIHPWNVGTTELRFRQSDTFNPSDPTAAVDTFLGFATMFGLTREGKANQDGIPKNPLQLMVILNFFRQHGGYLAGLPTPVQDVLMGGGAALGQAFGLRAWYEKYLPSHTGS